MILENDYLKVELDKSFTIRDKRNDVVWNMAETAEQLDIAKLTIDIKAAVQGHIPCAFTWEETNTTDTLRVTLRNPNGKEMGTCRCGVELVDDAVRFTIVDYKGEFSNLGFPPPLEQDALLIPMQNGTILREPRERYIKCFHNIGLSMRWFGGLKGDSAYLAIFETPWNATLWSSGEKLEATPTWELSKDEWSYPRTITYRFMKGGPTEVCKTYRTWAEGRDLVKTLRDKAADNPLVEKMAGLRMIKIRLLDHQCEEYMKNLPEWSVPGGHKVWSTFDDALQMANDIKDLGVKNAAIVLTGWTIRGYDNLHPDILPPCEEIGGSDGLHKLIKESPFPVGLHDNYTDIYADAPSFPHGIRILADGTRSGGNVWDGGQAFNVCLKPGLEYCKRNMKDVMKFNPKLMFIDVLGAGAPQECFDPDHPIDNQEDVEYRGKLFQHLMDQGQIVGAEVGQDWAVKHVHYCEGIMGESYIPFHEDRFRESMPLWNLTFHDCVVAYWYQMRTYAQDYIYYRVKPECFQDWREKMLWDLVFGNPSNWTFKGEFPDMHQRMKDTLILEESHEKIGFEQMTDHQLLSDDGKIRRSTFSDGTQITVNFNEEPADVDGTTIDAMGYDIASS
ncbi:DUF5696 domain-containing protein [Planctomycetota bacterium]